MTGTSKAVRWLAIKSEGRAREIRGAIRGARNSHISGRATVSRKRTRTPRTDGSHGQRGKVALTLGTGAADNGAAVGTRGVLSVVLPPCVGYLCSRSR